MTHTGKTKKALALMISLLLALSFAPLFSVILQPQANAAVATNRNSSNYVYGHYYYYPAGTTFIKSIHVGYDKDKDKAQSNAVNDQNPYLLGQDWLDGMGSNIFKKYNYIYIAYGTTTDITQAWGTYIRMKHSSGTPSPYAFTVNGQSVNFTLGSDVDFNKDRGSGSDYIYLYKTADPRFGLPITEFRSGDGTADTDKWESYFLTAERDNTGELSDFNRNAGGHYLWLHYGNYSVFTDVTTQLTAMHSALEEAKAVNTTGLTESSIATLQAAINAAQPIWDAYNANIYKCATYTAADIQAKTAALNNALNGLATAYYTVIFDGAGATGGAMTDQRIPTSVGRQLSANGFTREFTVNYEYNGATGGNSTTHDVAISSFNGWATSLYGTTVYADREEVNGIAAENGEVKLYANWRDNGVILPTPTLDGYTFKGWYTDPSLSQNYIAGSGAGGSNYSPPSDITLYAKWEETTYHLLGFTSCAAEGVYSITKDPNESAKMTDTVKVTLKLDKNLYNCEPVLTCNTGTVTLLPYNAGGLVREYTITGITEDYIISIGEAVPPTYTVTFVDSLDGEVLGVVSGLALGATNVPAPDVSDYVAYNEEQHMKFTGWDRNFTLDPVNANITVHTVYQAENHTWNDGTVITNATCQAPGEKTIGCVWCSETKTVEIPQADHVFNRKVTTADYLVSQATCDFPACYQYCCANCDARGGDTYYDGEKLNHSLTKTEAKEATCTEGGWNAYWTCGLCNKMFSDANGNNRITSIPVVDPNGHTLTLHAAQPATCINAGTYAYYTCSVCQKLFSDQQGTTQIEEADTVQPATGIHNLRKTNAVPVTCTSDGSIAYWTCSVCQKKFSDEAGENQITDAEIVIEHSGHEFSAERAETRYLQKSATCTEAAVYYKSCINCGEKGTETFIFGEPNDHAFYWVIDREATCAEPGMKHEKCRNCTETRNLETPIQPTGRHNFTIQAVKDEAKKSDATCTAPARYYYSCSVCGTVEGNDNHVFNYGSANGHTFGDWVTDREATCSEAGSRHRTCTVCDYSEVGSIAKTNHVDSDGDYKCDVCNADVTPSGLCPYCHGTHSGFPGVLIGLIHRILYFFKTLFG